MAVFNDASSHGQIARKRERKKYGRENLDCLVFTVIYYVPIGTPN